MADNLAKYVTQHGLLYLSTLHPFLSLHRNRLLTSNMLWLNYYERKMHNVLMLWLNNLSKNYGFSENVENLLMTVYNGQYDALCSTKSCV